MFFVLSKVIGFLTSPFWWIVIALVITFCVKNRVLKRRMTVAIIVLFLFFSNPVIFRFVAGVWEGEMQKAETMRGKSDVCVVLGGISSYDEPTGRVRFTRSADRFFQAIDLYEKGIVKKIIISGGSSRLIIKNRPEAAPLKDFLIELGVPDSLVLVDSLSRNTYENAINTLKLVKQNGWSKKIILITSASHMKRAAGCFEKAGFTVYPYSADPLKGTGKPSVFDYFMPSVGVLENWNYLTHEWVGLIMYKIKGYV